MFRVHAYARNGGDTKLYAPYRGKQMVLSDVRLIFIVGHSGEKSDLSLDFLTKSDHREADVRFVSHMYDSNQQIFRNRFYYKN